MTLAASLFAVALVVTSPTNAPAAFSAETERTFAVPDISERSVWLDCGMDFAATASNRVEIAFGPDIDGDGALGTSPLASWNLARVRLSGPEVSSAQIALQRNRHATVFIVR